MERPPTQLPPAPSAPQRTASNYSQLAVQVHAFTLASDYESNPIKADASYRSRIIVVEGMVDDIGRNITGTPYVSLSGDMMPQDISVNCYFAKDNESQVIGISKLT